MTAQKKLSHTPYTAATDVLPSLSVLFEVVCGWARDKVPRLWRELRRLLKVAAAPIVECRFYASQLKKR